MSFIKFSDEPSKPVRQISAEIMPEGSRMAQLCFVGEAPNKTELKIGKPFQGETGGIFDHCLHGAGIIRAQQYMTYFIKEFSDRKSINKYVSDRGILTRAGCYWRDALADELQDVSSKIIVPMGAPATAALLGIDPKITKRRGYLTYATDLFNNRPVLPTLAPYSCSYGGNYINKYYITHDFTKVRNLLTKKRVDDFDETGCIYPSTISQVENMITEMRSKGIFACDIEVSNYEVSAISFANRSDLAYSILFADKDMWTLEEEVLIWRMLASLLEDPTITKIGQNFIFDMHFLMVHQHIFIKGKIIDTMVAHHILYPDFLKGLEFLGSIYTHRLYWKDMVKFKNLKKDN